MLNVKFCIFHYFQSSRFFNVCSSFSENTYSLLNYYWSQAFPSDFLWCMSCFSARGYSIATHQSFYDLRRLISNTLVTNDLWPVSTGTCLWITLGSASSTASKPCTEGKPVKTGLRQVLRLNLAQDLTRILICKITPV